MALDKLEKIIEVTVRLQDKFSKDLSRLTKKSMQEQAPLFAQAERSQLRSDKATNRLIGSSTKMNRLMGGQAQQLINTTSLWQKFANKNDTFGKSLFMTQENFVGMEKNGARMNTKMGRLGNTTRKLATGMKGFRMELLGVMFFGMGVSRMFTGLLGPAMEVFGFFDLFRVMLLVLFMPIVEMLFPLFLSIMEYFMNLSDRTKKMIGIFVLVGIALGFFLMILGVIGLGVGAIIMVISQLIQIGGELFPVLGAWGAVAVGLIAGTTTLTTSVSVFGGVLATLTVFIIGVIRKNEGLVDAFASVGVTVTENMTLWELLKATVGGAMDLMANKFGLGRKEGETWGDMIKSKFIDIGDEVLKNNPTLGKWYILFESVRDLIEGFDIEEFLDTLIDMSTSLSDIVDIGTDLIDFFGLVEDGADDLESKVVTLTEIFTSLWEILKNIISMNLGKALANIIKLTVRLFNKSGSGSDNSNSGDEDMKTHGDFLFRPGQKPIGFSPNDTIIGTKGGLPGGNNSFNITNNINVSDSAEIERMIDNNNSKLVDDIRRLTPIGG